MPDFGPIAPKKPMVYLSNPNPSYNMTWEGAEKLAAYLKGLGVELINIVAVSTEFHEYDKKWFMENGFSMKEPLYLQGETVIKFHNGTSLESTSVTGHVLSVLAQNLQSDPKFHFERLLEDHAVTGIEISHYYMQFSSIQEAVKKLF